jgi:RHS repeat-associated protein
LEVNDSDSGQFDLSYDPAGRLLSTENQYGTLTYAYDADGRMLSRQVAGEPVLQYSYDPVGNLKSASLPQASASFVYDARSQLSTISRANGVLSQYEYDPAGRLTSLNHSGPAGLIIRQAYAYDATGNRTSYSTNIAQPLSTSAVKSSTFDAGNRLLQRDVTAYLYDSNGNLVSSTDLAGTTSYRWDSRNRLQSISGPRVHADFQYDPASNMISQSVNGKSRIYVLDDLTNIAALNDNGDLQNILSGRAVDGHFAVVHTAAQSEYSLSDAINSTTATVDQAGKQIGSFSYEPFGGGTSSETAYPFQFTGRTPIEGGLYYYRARFFDPKNARFIAEDIVLSRGSTGYLYALNNPVMLTDPSGLLPKQAEGALAVIGGVAGIGTGMVLVAGGSVIGGSALLILAPTLAAAQIAGYPGMFSLLASTSSSVAVKNIAAQLDVLLDSSLICVIPDSQIQALNRLNQILNITTLGSDFSTLRKHPMRKCSLKH